MEKDKKSADKKVDHVKTIALAAIAIFGSGMVLTGYILPGYINDASQPIIKRYSKSNNNNKSTVVKIKRSVNYDRLKSFVETASLNNSSFDSVIGDLSKETFGMTEKQKYVYFFNEVADFDALTKYVYGNEETIGNPVLYKVDQELGKIYFTNYIGGTSSGDRYVSKVFDYESDDDFYYVNEYIAKVSSNDKFYRTAVNDTEVEVNDFYGNENSFDILVWKFDKDYNFVSTTYRR